MGATCIFMKRADFRSAWVNGEASQHFDDDASGTGIERANAAGREWAALTIDHHIFRVMADKA
jgi:hypothetical protein